MATSIQQDNFYSPENDRFYTSQPYAPLDAVRREIRLLEVYPFRIHGPDLPTLFPHWNEPGNDFQAMSGQPPFLSGNPPKYEGDMSTQSRFQSRNLPKHQVGVLPMPLPPPGAPPPVPSLDFGPPPPPAAVGRHSGTSHYSAYPGAPLPAGWARCQTQVKVGSPHNSGKVTNVFRGNGRQCVSFYVNQYTGHTQWEVPHTPVPEAPPEFPNGFLACELVDQVSLGTANGRYIALSYSAGDPGNTKQIMVNGFLFNVFANLEHALECVRKHQTKESDEKFLIWADQICIDQSNVEERSQQVQFMPEIFQNSGSVFACLSTASSPILPPSPMRHIPQPLPPVALPTQHGKLEIRGENRGRKKRARSLSTSSSNSRSGYDSDSTVSRPRSRNFSTADRHRVRKRKATSLSTSSSASQDSDDSSDSGKKVRTILAPFSWIWKTLWSSGSKQSESTKKATRMARTTRTKTRSSYEILPPRRKTRSRYVTPPPTKTRLPSRRPLLKRGTIPPPPAVCPPPPPAGGLLPYLAYGGAAPEQFSHLETQHLIPPPPTPFPPHLRRSETTTACNQTLERFGIKDTRQLQNPESVFQIFIEDLKSPSGEIGWASEIARIVNATWWTRAWVFQEFMLAARLLIIYHHETWPWHVLSPFLHLFCEQEQRLAALKNDLEEQENMMKDEKDRPQDLAHMKRSDEDKHSSASEELHRLRGAADKLGLLQNIIQGTNSSNRERVLHFVKSRESWNGPKALSSLLATTHLFQSTDPRDIVYAFSGLADPSYKIIPDYRSSNAMFHVLVDTAQKIVGFENSLDILDDAILLGKEFSGFRLPSWVPNWGLKPRKEMLKCKEDMHQTLPRGSASSNRPADVSFHRDEEHSPNILMRVRGQCLGTIARIEQESEFLTVFSSSAHFFIETSPLVRVGDQVWVLHGAKKVYVLRTHLERQFSLIAEAVLFDKYPETVSEFMIGKAIDLEEKGEAKVVEIDIV